MRSQKQLLEHLFITLPTMVGVAYFVLWACAPPATLPPPVAAMGGPSVPIIEETELTPTQAPRMVSGELGIGVMGGIDTENAEGGGWVWLSTRIEGPKKAVDLGLVASGAYMLDAGAFAGGGYLRIMKKRPESHSQLGLELSTGVIWARVAVPYIKQVEENKWIYFSPAITASLVSDLQFPVGVAVRTGRLGVVRFEGGAAFRVADFFTPAIYVAFSGSLNWRQKSERNKTNDFYEPVPTTSQPASTPTLQPCVPCAINSPLSTQPSSSPATPQSGPIP
jgi:hypothetical protein